MNLSRWNDKARFDVVAVWDRIVNPTDTEPKKPNWDECCPVERMGMIVGLYFPNLKSPFSKLEEQETIYRDGFYKFLKSTTGLEGDLHNNEKLIQTPLNRLNTLLNEFQKVITKQNKYS